MPHVPLKNLISRNSRTFAINVSDLRMAYWLLKCAEKHNQPIILQISKRVLQYEGIPFLSILIDLVNKFSVSASTHLDHCNDSQLCHEAIAAGIGGVLFDGSCFSPEENFKTSKYLVDFADKKGAFIEGELAPIPGEEDGQNNKTSQQISFQETLNFVNGTGIHVFAPYFGNHHGLYKADSMSLDLNYLEKVSNILTIPLCIHGGSGILKDQADRINKIGYGKINFSTDFKEALKTNDNSLDPFENNCAVEKMISTAFENLREIWLPKEHL